MSAPTLSDIQTNIKCVHEMSSKLSDFPDDAKPRDSYLRKLEELTVKYESGVVELRNYCERKYRVASSENGKPLLIPYAVKGRVEVNEYGWLHIKLDALLPHCRYATPTYLSDTITRLLDDYEGRRGKLPRFESAALVIDEHCNIDSRTVYDQDNKGYKAIPNAIKGRLIKDDDQFHLHLHLTSTRSTETACHIWLLRQEDAGDFFYLHSENSLFRR